MFFYNVNRILQQNHLRRLMMAEGIPADVIDETSYLLPKGYAGQDSDDESERPYSFVCIPQRYILGIMGCLAIVNAYTMRVSLSVAITEMVAPARHTKNNTDACFTTNATVEITSVESRSDNSYLYDWDETTQGLILSSFYWGYVLSHIPGGLLAEKYGGKMCLGLGILSTAIFTILTPFLINISDGNWKVLVALRVIEGFAEGPTYPALNILLAKWVPLNERASIGTLVYAGGQVGTIFSNLISGILIHYTGSWESVFYLFGGLGVVWVVFWYILCYSEPDQHPFITEAERDHLRKELEHGGGKAPVPWGRILTSVPVWALIAAQIGHDWGFFSMITDLPKYFKDVLKFDVKANGLWTSLPYVFMWTVSMLSGYLCDWMISRKMCSIGFARKFFTSIASIGPAIFMMLASYSGCDRMMAVWMFTISMGFMGTFYCGMKVNALDLSPQYAGTLMAIVNGTGAITGILTPYIIGILTEEQTVSNWRTAFWISFAIFLITNAIFVLFASGEEQPWNNSKTSPNTENEENSATEKNNSKVINA